MGDVLPLKRCSYSDNGLCIALNVFACVCHRGGSSKMLATLGRQPRLLPAPSYNIPIHEVASKECPPPYEVPRYPGGIDDLCPDEDWPGC